MGNAKRNIADSSLANLAKGGTNLTRHGWWSRGIQTTGVPYRSGCPLALLGDCDCEVQEGDQCPIMLQQFVDRVTSLEELGISRVSAQLITRLEFQSMLGHYILSRQGYFRGQKDNEAGLITHGAWIHIGVVDHALLRTYKDVGITRAPQGGGPLTPESLAVMHREAKEAEEEADSE